MIGNYFKVNSSPEMERWTKSSVLQNPMAPEEPAPFLFCRVNLFKNQKILTSIEIHSFQQ